jgi:hypothetical protein
MPSGKGAVKVTVIFDSLEDLLGEQAIFGDYAVKGGLGSQCPDRIPLKQASD